MRATHPRRSLFVTIFALMSFALSGAAILAFVAAKAWDRDSYYWHSDVAWSVEYIPPSTSLEQQRINHARNKAQSLYEGPMTAAFAATAVATFVASLGLLFRKNWARLLIITVLMSDGLRLVHKSNKGKSVCSHVFPGPPLARTSRPLR
jgi:hypothetical protein